MAKGSDLPNELLVKIAGLVHPASIIDFAVASHRLLEISNDRLALHRETAQSRKVMDTQRGYPASVFGPRPQPPDQDEWAVCVRRALVQPHKAWYVQTLVIRCNSDSIHRVQPSESTPSNQQVSKTAREENLLVYRRSLEELRTGMDPKIFETLYNALALQQTHLLNSLLLQYLPNLTKIIWDDQHPTTASPLAIMMEAIARNPVPLVLCRLVIVEFGNSGSGVGNPVPFSCLQSSLQIPTVRLIRARRIAWDQRHALSVPQKSSNVTVIDLTHQDFCLKGTNMLSLISATNPAGHSDVHAMGFEELIAAPRTLIKLTIVASPTQRNASHDIPSAERLITTLSKHTNDSLESLSIRAGHTAIAVLPYLSSFTKLKFLETEPCLLFSTLELNSIIAINKLPLKLEHLRLYDDPFLFFDDIVTLLTTLLSYKRTFPRWRQLDLGLDDGRQVNDRTGISHYMHKLADKVQVSCARKDVNFRTKFRTDGVADAVWDQEGGGEWWRQQGRNPATDPFFT